jgi:exopolysaccharide biosynthesis polyprenyl glycosylphosphotransferase
LFQQVMDCHERGVSITPMPIMYERLTGKIAVEHIGSQWYVALPLEKESFSIANAIFHRAIDLVFGLLFFILFLLLTPFIALAIRLDSNGSIFYRQERMGLHGKVFHVYKFRSMKQDAESRGIAIWASENDPRVTRVGKFIRKTRLDELPQTMNVLLGDMSMVGPRPERPQLVAQLQKQIPFYRTRLAAKPGLTGWAQVNYGYVGTVEDTLVKLQYDLYYIKHASAWFDLRILVKTIGVVLRLEGR